jgi:hypothetical protein
MSGFFDEQGGTRVCGEPYMGCVAADNRGQRRSPKKEPLMDGH